MKQALGLFALVAAAFAAAHAGFGYDTVYRIGYGAFALMAAMISATFLWLWVRRATPLALGMSFSWAGAASIISWWWLYHLTDRPDAMRESGALFIFLALYFVGAILHFAVIARSLGLSRNALFWPLAGALALSTLLRVAF